MNDRATLARRAAFAASLAWAGLAFLAGDSLPDTLTRVVSYVPAIIGIGVVAFDKWMWRWWIVRSWTSRPRIRGTWRATLQPSRESHIPEGGNRGPISAVVVIEQTYWSVHARLTTVESESATETATILKTPDSQDATILVGVYLNDPRATERQRSPTHRGAFRLPLIGDSPQSIAGSYWTDRLTTGTMDLDFIDHKTNRDPTELVRIIKGQKQSTG